MRSYVNPAAIAVAAALIGLPCFAQAQCAGDTSSGAVKSNGIELSIISVVLTENGRGVALSLDIKNLTKYDAHILVVGNHHMSTNTGSSLIRQRFSGISSCEYGSDDQISIDHCMKDKAKDINQYSDIDSCGDMRTTIYFGPMMGSVPVKNGDTINYALRTIVRYSPHSEDPLMNDRPPSAPRIVTLNLPPVPIQ